MRKTFILDASVLLYNPYAIHNFDDNDVIIPIEVIEELNSFKRDMSDLGRNSRTIIKMLDDYRRKGKLGEGIGLDNGGMLRVHAQRARDVLSKRGLHVGDVFQNRLLNLAVLMNQSDSEQPTILVTKSINLRLLADALGIYAEDYEDDKVHNIDFYTGIHYLKGDAETVGALADGEAITLDNQVLCPNEYVEMRVRDDDELLALGRVGRDAHTVHPLRQRDNVLGIGPLNMAQRYAFDALLDDDIKLVTLQGKAGTGKSLLAVAAGLYKVLVEDAYNRVLVSRPTVPMGRDIGYLPGEVEEKLRPWMQPIYDAIELIREVDRRSRQRSLPPDLLESDEIGIEPLTYIRGRSIPHQFMIIDEAQNLTPLEVKTIITRVGRNTKLVLTGDPDQIDNPYVDSMSNGFTSLVNRFRSQSIAAHVTLEKGERSELAEIAANLL